MTYSRIFRTPCLSFRVAICCLPVPLVQCGTERVRNNRYMDNIMKVTRGNDFNCQKIEVIMILGNFCSLIELLIFGTACLML